jgi:hypothetical protein
MATEYQITIQPDLRRTIQDPGTITSILMLNLEQVLGIIAGVSITIEGRYALNEIINIVRLANNEIMTTITFSHQIQDVGFCLLPSSRASHLLDYYNLSIQRGLTPQGFLATFINRSRLPISLDYWCILVQPEQRVPIGLVVQFQTLGFLQGVISAFTWLGKDWRDRILLIHHQNQLESIVGFAEVPPLTE